MNKVFFKIPTVLIAGIALLSPTACTDKDDPASTGDVGTDGTVQFAFRGVPYKDSSEEDTDMLSQVNVYHFKGEEFFLRTDIDDPYADDFLQEDDINSIDREGKAIFNIATESSQIGVITRANREEEESPIISELRRLVADKYGKIVPHYYGRIDNQNTKLTIEGLTYGDYTLLCLGTLNEAEGISFNEPEYINDAWLVNEKEDQPVDGIYCYKKVPFTLGADGLTSNVILEHIAARVSVDIDMPNISQWRHIKRVSVSINEEIPTSLDASGSWFYTCAPLQIWMRDDGKLAVRYYSPYTLKDVKVTACFNKVSPEWVTLAVFEEVNPFEEAFFTLPITQQDCVFDGESGRKVKIPAIPDLSPGDVSLKFEWYKDDVFMNMNKIADIKLNWFIRFSAYGADNGHPYWTYMNPLLCRLAIGLAYDLTYMFSSQEYIDGYEPWDGKFVNSGRVITLEEILTRVNRQGGLMMGCVHGVLGPGGGQTFGMSADRYYNFYPDTSPVGGETFNGARQTIFHEFAHCLGYGHDGNMTYGEAFTRFSAKVLVELGWAERLPVSKVTDITSLPME